MCRMIGEMLHVYLFHNTASDKIICSISLKILIKCFILTFLCTFFCVQNIVLKPGNCRSKKCQCALSLLLMMPIPIVLTAYFQVTIVDISMQCVVGLFFVLFETVYWKTWGQNENLNGNYLLARSSHVRLLSCSRLLIWTKINVAYILCHLWSMAEGDVNNIVKPCSK